MMDEQHGADQGGEAPCFAHLSESDVTDSMLANALRELADAAVIADAGGTIVFWNGAAERLFGWSASEAIGQTLDVIIPERLRERHWAGYQRTMATGQTSYGNRLLEVPAVHRDGRTLSVAFTVTLLHPTGMTHPNGVVAVLRDETARWQERRDLKAEIRRLQSGSDVKAG